MTSHWKALLHSQVLALYPAVNNLLAERTRSVTGLFLPLAQGISRGFCVCRPNPRRLGFNWPRRVRNDAMS